MRVTGFGQMRVTVWGNIGVKGFAKMRATVFLRNLRSVGGRPQYGGATVNPYCDPQFSRQNFVRALSFFGGSGGSDTVQLHKRCMPVIQDTGRSGDVSPGTKDVSPRVFVSMGFYPGYNGELSAPQDRSDAVGRGPPLHHLCPAGTCWRGWGAAGVIRFLSFFCIFWFLVETPGGPPEAFCEFFWRAGVSESGLRRVAPLKRFSQKLVAQIVVPSG